MADMEYKNRQRKQHNKSYIYRNLPDNTQKPITKKLAFFW